MKKKIKDLTLEEVHEYCSKKRSCFGCQYLIKEGCLMKNIDVLYSHPEVMNSEIEIPTTVRKAILIAIKPQNLFKILNGVKTIEARKNKALIGAIKKLISEYGYAQIVAYCSNDKKNYLYRDYKHWFVSFNSQMLVDFKYDRNGLKGHFNGKVLCTFKCYNVEEIFGYPSEPYYCDSDLIFETNSLTANQLLEKTCLNHEELENYLNDVSPHGYAIHITELNIFDKPKKLNELKQCRHSLPLTKSPQNFTYIAEVPTNYETK